MYLDGSRAAVRTEETNLGNLTADANLWYANRLAGRHVAVSIKNGGGSIQGDPNRTFRIVTLNFLANGGDGYPFPALASPNRSQLYAAVGYGDPDVADEGVPDFPVEPQANDPGRNGGFSYTGGEQDALAEYLAVFHSTAGTAYRTVETGRTEDLRVQDLSVRNWVAP